MGKKNWQVSGRSGRHDVKRSYTTYNRANKIPLMQCFRMIPTCSELFVAGFKLSFMKSDCVGSHFRNLFLLDVPEAPFYTLCFNNTPNVAAKRTADVYVYEILLPKAIIQHHVETFFIENT